RLRVIDYKTAAAAEDPRKAHRVSGAWIDLQLPLYRYLAEQRGWGERIEVGYVCLPKALADTGWKPAVWPGSRDKVSHEALHAEALDKAREVARAMRRGVFWPPGGLPRYADGFELLGGDAWSRREEWAAEAGAAP
ncbi:MAG: PD-(D/E)XK nuclease family protein, partial [Planctomycetota bacterium]